MAVAISDYSQDYFSLRNKSDSIHFNLMEEVKVRDQLIDGLRKENGDLKAKVVELESQIKIPSESVICEQQPQLSKSPMQLEKPLKRKPSLKAM